MVKVGIIGATGYGGVELVRLLLGHPAAELAALSSVSFEGKRISEVYPSLFQICEDVLTNQEDLVEKSEVIFTALPHGLSQQIAAQCKGTGKVLIDLGADFRLEDAGTYESWYGCEYIHPELHAASVYGLCELNREKLAAADIIGNPGCYPTAAALGLWPALKAGLGKGTPIIIDAKSGVTGAGRGLTQGSHFAELNEAFHPYKVADHRHGPEMEQTLSGIAGAPVRVTFVPHLLPVNRGIISTMYLEKRGMALEEIRALYTAQYAGEPFVRVLPAGAAADLKQVKYSNYCDISLHEDAHTDLLIVVSAIDNMVKGAAGQAVQNMNIRMGLPEDMGLRLIPPAF